MKPITHSDLLALLRPHDAPCVSLHVAIDGREGSGPAATKLANAVRAARPGLQGWAEGSAERMALASDTGSRLDFLATRLAEDPWESRDGAFMAPTRGLALFVSPGFSALHRLVTAPQELAACDAAFHAMPVLEQHAADLSFHLLTIHRDQVRLFEGSAERLDDLPLGDIPASLLDATGRVFDDSQQGRSFHGSPASGTRGNAQATGSHSHGYGGSDRDDEKDVTRFLLRIGHGLRKGVGEANGTPLLVMAIDKKLGAFRKLHPNVHLAEGGVALDPGGRSVEELHARAWAALEPVRERRLAGTLEGIEASLPRQRASKDLVAIAQAAVSGRVATLVLARGKRDAGHLDLVTGDLHLDGPGHQGPDVLEQIAASVLLHRGDVLFASPESLHSHAGAIFRY